MTALISQHPDVRNKKVLPKGRNHLADFSEKSPFRPKGSARWFFTPGGKTARWPTPKMNKNGPFWGPWGNFSAANLLLNFRSVTCFLLFICVYVSKGQFHGNKPHKKKGRITTSSYITHDVYKIQVVGLEGGPLEAKLVMLHSRSWTRCDFTPAKNDGRHCYTTSLPFLGKVTLGWGRSKIRTSGPSQQ